jgi:hypothetical protein
MHARPAHKYSLAFRANFQHAGLPRAEAFSAAGAFGCSRLLMARALLAFWHRFTYCLHEPTPYALQTSLFVRVCLPVIQTSLRSANTTSFLTGKRSWRHQHHVCPCYALPYSLHGGATPALLRFPLDVGWAEACCAGTRPCHAMPPGVGCNVPS